MVSGPVQDLYHKTLWYEKPSFLKKDPLFRSLQFCPANQLKHLHASMVLPATCGEKTPESVFSYYNAAS